MKLSFKIELHSYDDRQLIDRLEKAFYNQRPVRLNLGKKRLWLYILEVNRQSVISSSYDWTCRLEGTGQ